MDGITGIYNLQGLDNEIVHKAFLATGALQHRGGACAGIAVGNSDGIYLERDLGAIGNVITPNRIRNLQGLSPMVVIGNVGYTKNKYPSRENAEPIQIYPKKKSNLEVFLTMDGYLVKEDDLKEELENEYSFETRNKAEVIGALLHKYLTEEGISFDAGRKLVDKLHGIATFTLCALVYDGKETRLIALNDDTAFEPFSYGIIDDNFVVSSESCSHRRLGGFPEQCYAGAEMTICSFSNGPEIKRLRKEKALSDIFQAVYFGQVGSLFNGREIFDIRRNLGHKLVEYYGTNGTDIVIPNPDSGWGVTIGIFEGIKADLEKRALDYSRYEKENIIFVKDKILFEKLRKLQTIYPALIKQAQAVRTFQEGEKRTRAAQVGLKFGGIDSLLNSREVISGDDSIVKGSVSEGGSLWVLYNAGVKYHEFWISYGPMFFPSFKEWHRGPECLHELAAQRAFKNTVPYDKSLEEINDAVSKLIAEKLGITRAQIQVRYNSKKLIEEVTGHGSFQALDASYPIAEEFWPDFIKKEVDKFHKYESP